MTSLQSRKRPAATGPNRHTLRKSDVRPSAEPAQLLLARLDGVQTSGKGWRARCPSCEGKSRKLSIGTGNDGCVLLHCFAGCPAAEVLGAIGLSLSDLYPEPVRGTSPMAKRERKQAMQAHAWAAALEVLAHESNVVALAASDLAKGNPLNETDNDRLALALDRIQQAREVMA